MSDPKPKREKGPDLDPDWKGPKRGDAFIAALDGEPGAVRLPLRKTDDGAYTVVDATGRLCWLTWCADYDAWMDCILYNTLYKANGERL